MKVPCVRKPCSTVHASAFAPSNGFENHPCGHNNVFILEKGLIEFHDHFLLAGSFQGGILPLVSKTISLSRRKQLRRHQGEKAMRIYRFIILTSQLTEVSRSSGQIKYTNDGFSNSKER